MVEAILTISLMISEDYTKKDVDEIVDDIQKIVSMTDSSDIQWNYGSAEII